MQEEVKAIGIDVSKAKLDVCLIVGKHEYCHFQVSNTRAGINTAIRKFKGYEGKIIMESTGRYHLLSALLLSKSGLDVRVINPLLAKKHSTGNIRKNKTDKADAQTLANMALLEPKLPDKFLNEKDDIGIRQKIGLISSLEHQLQSLKAMLKDYTEFQEQLDLTESAAEKKIKETIKDLSKAKRELEEEIEMSVANNNDNYVSRKQILTSIPGVSNFLATLLLQMLDTNNCNSNKQWIAFTGMDVALKQSGQWVGKGRLSKRGNAYLRKRLFSGAWGAIMNNKLFRMIYDELRSKGRRYREAVVIIARKILRIAFTLLKKEMFFDAKLCFSI
ncbi:MAG: IS110 family transposase [Patescibacteria group bacterium]|nr:IS110 family transposase [Patescibacteria group bacterium]